MAASARRRARRGARATAHSEPEAIMKEHMAQKQQLVIKARSASVRAQQRKVYTPVKRSSSSSGGGGGNINSNDNDNDKSVAVASAGAPPKGRLSTGPVSISTLLSSSSSDLASPPRNTVTNSSLPVLDGAYVSLGSDAAAHLDAGTNGKIKPRGDRAVTEPIDCARILSGGMPSPASKDGRLAFTPDTAARFLATNYSPTSSFPNPGLLQSQPQQKECYSSASLSPTVCTPHVFGDDVLLGIEELVINSGSSANKLMVQEKIQEEEEEQECYQLQQQEHQHGGRQEEEEEEEQALMEEEAIKRAVAMTQAKMDETVDVLAQACATSLKNQAAIASAWSEVAAKLQQPNNLLKAKRDDLARQHQAMPAVLCSPSDVPAEQPVVHEHAIIATADVNARPVHTSDISATANSGVMRFPSSAQARLQWRASRRKTETPPGQQSSKTITPRHTTIKPRCTPGPAAKPAAAVASTSTTGPEYVRWDSALRVDLLGRRRSFASLHSTYPQAVRKGSVGAVERIGKDEEQAGEVAAVVDTEKKKEKNARDASSGGV